MDSEYLPYLVAGFVAMLVWGIIVVAKSFLDPEKRKLQNRLAGDGKGLGILGGTSQLPLSITRNHDDAVAISALLVRWRPMEGLHRMIVQAYPNMTVATFLCIAGGVAFVMFMIASVMTNNLIMAGVAFALGAYFPFLMLGQKRNRRQRTIALQLPEALEFLARVLKAGHSFSTGIQMMSEELPDPLKSEFRRCYEQHSLGQPLEDTL